MRWWQLLAVSRRFRLGDGLDPSLPFWQRGGEIDVGRRKRRLGGRGGGRRKGIGRIEAMFVAYLPKVR